MTDSPLLSASARESSAKARIILARIKAFEEAVRAHEFRGAAHPEDVAEIENNYRSAKAKLIEESCPDSTVKLTVMTELAGGYDE